ncbi:MAG: copper homeostasis protein CutC [Ginsengibacter sp.]
MKLEVIGFGIENCMAAQRGGAHRVELCDNPLEGGTTPSYGLITTARKMLHIELYPMIRPRGGDFLYSEDEFEIMKADIALCKRSGCEGIVTGLLTNDGKVDKQRTRLLTDLAYPLGVTFHRAFDRSRDPWEAMEDIIDAGCERILTSGQKKNALEGSGLIKQLIEKADDRIVIMPGSGIRADNIGTIARLTGANEFHTSARCIQKSKMIHHAPIDGNEEITGVDEDEIKRMLQAYAGS